MVLLGHGCLPVLRSSGAPFCLVSAAAKRLGSSVHAGILTSTASSRSPSSRLVLPWKLLWEEGSIPVSLLFVSGADDSFIDETLAKQAGLPLVELAQPRVVQDLDGRTLETALLRTASLTLIVSGNHQEQIVFFFIQSSASPVILGSPWMATHNPQFDWSAGTITAWSMACHARCLRFAQPPAPQATQAPPPAIDFSGVPEVYHDLGEVFSKQRALSVPPHWPHDCAIDLCLGAPFPAS